MHPKYKRKAAKAKAKTNGNSSSQKDLQARKFPGLSMPDSEWKPAEPYPDEKEKRPTASDFLDGPPMKRPRTRNSPPRYAQPDDRPVLYKIYDGSVTNVRDFGAFVQLEGIRGRTEGRSSTTWLISGMIHVSMLTGGRVSSAADVLKRNDRVKVKVMSIVGEKYGLSMKDVDQRTGEDQS